METDADKRKSPQPSEYDQVSEASVKRSHWGNRVEFFLATIGYSIGMGNLTRFPYVCMKNGGGAFLIPWFVAIVFGGIPLFCLELALGQFSGRSPLTMFQQLSPALKGIGYASCILSGIYTVYYSMQLSWSLFYMLHCFTNEVPWKGCGHPWNTENCFDPASGERNCTEFGNNITAIEKCANSSQQYVLPSEEFWNNVILGLNNSNMDNIGNLRWELVVGSFVSWTVVTVCLMRGVKSLGKVVYVTATLPYVLLTALIIRGVTLDGAADGLAFYLKPNFTTLADHNVWIEASLQMFFSVGPGWGGLVTMASYNKFHHRFESDAVLITLGDTFTALYGGIAVFSALGFMAKQTKVPIKHYAASGFGLSFVVFPQVLAEMPGSTFWSILFFFNLFTMGIDTQFATFDTVLSGILDASPKLRNYEVSVTIFTAVVLFLAGLPFATEGGMYLYVLFDWYAWVITLTVVALLEVIIVSYVYGIKRFSLDVEFMLGKKPSIYWKAGWTIVTPLFMAMLVFFGLWNLRAPTYQGYEYPTWSIAFGWLIAFASFAPIPGFAIYAFITSSHRTIREKFLDIFTPTNEWVPAEKELRADYLDQLEYLDMKIIPEIMQAPRRRQGSNDSEEPEIELLQYNFSGGLPPTEPHHYHEN